MDHHPRKHTADAAIQQRKGRSSSLPRRRFQARSRRACALRSRPTKRRPCTGALSSIRWNARRQRFRNSVCRSIAIWPARRRRRWLFSRSWKNVRPSGCSIRKATIWAPAWMECFDTLFARGYGRVLIAGTDVPSLPLETTIRRFNYWTDTTSSWVPLSTAAIT